MTKLHILRASDAGQMLAEKGVNPEESALPPFVAEMDGKSYTFQVRVNAYNFTEHHKTLTITRSVDEIDHEPLPDVPDDGVIAMMMMTNQIGSQVLLMFRL